MSTPSLQSNAPSVGPSHIIIGEAAKIGFRSGTEKLRLKLNNDTSNKFAVAILGQEETDPSTIKAEWSKLKNKKWVPLNTDTGVVKAEISSVVYRLGLNKEEVINLANDNKLEMTIKEALYDYNKVEKTLSDLQKTLSDLISTIFPLVELSEKINVLNMIDEGLKTTEMHDIHLKKLCKKFIDKCKTLSVDNNFLVNISKERDALIAKLPLLKKGVPVREKIIESQKFGNKTLVHAAAMPLSLSGSPGRKAVRLNVLGNEDQKHRFFIKTDGHLYLSRPKGDRFHVPYSEDGGQNWVLLNVHSLSKRLLNISAEEIRRKAGEDENGGALSVLIKQNVDTITNFQQAFSVVFLYCEAVLRIIPKNSSDTKEVDAKIFLNYLKKEYPDLINFMCTKPDVKNYFEEKKSFKIEQELSMLDQDDLKMDKDFLKHLHQMIKDLLNEKKDLPSRLVAFDKFRQHLWFEPKLPTQAKAQDTKDNKDSN
jgi:hypothetical protein